MQTTAVVSKNHNSGMTRITYEVDIRTARSHVWKILADFTNVKWTKTINDAQYIGNIKGGVGMARHCNLQDGSTITERITEWREGSGFTYAIDNASNPVTTDSYVTWSATGDEQQTKVIFEVNYQLKYGILGIVMNNLMVKHKFRKLIITFMNELKTYAENPS